MLGRIGGPDAIPVILILEVLEEGDEHMQAVPAAALGTVEQMPCPHVAEILKIGTRTPAASTIASLLFMPSAEIGPDAMAEPYPVLVGLLK